MVSRVPVPLLPHPQVGPDGRLQPDTVRRFEDVESSSCALSSEWEKTEPEDRTQVLRLLYARFKLMVGGAVERVQTKPRAEDQGSDSIRRTWGVTGGPLHIYQRGALIRRHKDVHQADMREQATARRRAGGAATMPEGVWGGVSPTSSVFGPEQRVVV